MSVEVFGNSDIEITPYRSEVGWAGFYFNKDRVTIVVKDNKPDQQYDPGGYASLDVSLADFIEAFAAVQKVLFDEQR